MAQGLLPGMTLRLSLARDGAAETVVTQLDHVSDRGIEVLVPMRKLQRSPLPHGAAVRGSYTFQRMQWDFASAVLGSSADGALQYLKLPDEIACSERRNGFRLPTSIAPRALYRLVVHKDLPLDEEPGGLRGTVVDLGEGGLCLSSPASLHDGERLGISADLGPSNTFSARMQVTAIEEPPLGSRNRRMHCEFIAISQSDRDNIARYLIRRQLEMRRRGQL